jgi:serine/threonine-protein kinase HipA
VALQLASAAGIPTSQWRLEKVAGQDVLLLRRFDRMHNVRIPFLSAMSLLDAADNEPRSYLEIADALRQYGSRPEQDCAQLWRRIVFSILVSNTDDHLRNHGFLYDPTGGFHPLMT